MDYEGAVGLISQLESGSSGSEEFTINALKAINKEIKLTNFSKQQNDAVAEALVRSLSGPFSFSQPAIKSMTTVLQKPQPALQPKAEEKQILQQPELQVNAKPQSNAQPPAAKELSGATSELKGVMGNVSKIKLPDIKFNVPFTVTKPSQTKPAQQPSAVQQQEEQHAPIQKQPRAVVQQQTPAPKIIQKPQPAQQQARQQKPAAQIPPARSKTLKSILVGLPLHDQIDELSKISIGIDRKAFDKAHTRIIVSEINSLYEYSKTEPPTTNVFEQRLRDIRVQRLSEVMEKLGRKGVSGWA